MDLKCRCSSGETLVVTKPISSPSEYRTQNTEIKVKYDVHLTHSRDILFFSLVVLYNAVSEACGERKECCIPIPPFPPQHVGDHRHTRDPAALHFCDQRCPTCNYFCEQPSGCEGVHSGAHGMMRRCYFVSDQKVKHIP